MSAYLIPTVAHRKCSLLRVCASQILHRRSGLRESLSPRQSPQVPHGSPQGVRLLPRVVEALQGAQQLISEYDGCQLMSQFNAKAVCENIAPPVSHEREKTDALLITPNIHLTTNSLTGKRLTMKLRCSTQSALLLLLPSRVLLSCVRSSILRSSSMGECC